MQPGTTLRNRYQIIKLLGEGGFGQTFLAEDLGIPIDPKPRCVVKRLKTANLKAEELEPIFRTLTVTSSLVLN
jgi:eukaryotic-like serine/threonine-protein kinase